MIKFINPELFTFATTQETSDTYGAYSKTCVKASTAAVRKDDQGHLSPIRKTIFTIIDKHADAKFALEDGEFRQPSRFKRFVRDGKHQPNIAVYSDDESRKKCDLIAIAIPFNGYIVPIPENRGYRVIKGAIIASSKRNIDFKGEKYRKILYLLVEVNESLSRQDIEKHVNSHRVSYIKVNTYSLPYELNKDAACDADKVTLHRNTTITITCDVSSKSSELHTGVEVTAENIQGVVDTTKYNGIDVFTVYCGTDKSKGSTNTGHHSYFMENNDEKVSRNQPRHTAFPVSNGTDFDSDGNLNYGKERRRMNYRNDKSRFNK